MTEQETLQWLHQHGHFANPRYPDTQNVKEADLGALTLSHPLARQAIESIQSFDANMEALAIRHHSRSAMFDGDIGPATQELLSLPRCGMADFAAATDEATGSGSWPAGCGGGEGHSIRIDVDESNMPAHVRNLGWGLIKDTNARMYGAIGLRVLYVDHGEVSQIDMKWKVLAGSTIGLAQFNSRSCGDNVFHYLDPGYSGDFQMYVSLHAHELGHNCNLQHTRGGTMNPSILRVPNDWRNDVSFPTLRKFFGGEPIDVPPPDPSPPEPGDPVNGVLTIEGRLYKITGVRA